MKKQLTKALFSLGLISIANNVWAENLLQVFQQALTHDPTYQKADAQRLSTHEDVPISRSFLLPQFNAIGYSQYNNQKERVGSTINLPEGPATFGAGTFNYNSNGYSLDLTQAVFDYAAWATLSESKLSVKSADASYVAALQSLMQRTSEAYFNVLAAQDNLRYIEAEKKAIYQQLDQVTQQYKVGVVAITGVYQAQAAYDSIISQEISAANDVINQRENLRTITGKYYNRLASLEYNIPLMLPKPADPNKWVETALKQNWSLTASRYTAQAAKENVSVQRAGHLPVVDAYAEQDNLKTGTTPNGQTNSTANAVGIQLALPVFQGGLVTAQTKKASFDYQASLDAMTEVYRSVYNDTQQSYNNVVSGINQVKADRQAIVSNASSLRSTVEGFKVGTQTMLDVLQAQQDLYNAEREFSNDLYAYINATISLKEAAGTLSLKDLQQINGWLSQNRSEYSSLNISTIQNQANQNFNRNLQDKVLSDQILKAGGNLEQINKDSEKNTTPSLPDISQDPLIKEETNSGASNTLNNKISSKTSTTANKSVITTSTKNKQTS
ncbi:MAG: hypothetical protein CMF49_08605 [Legionellales bacterium]|nr:hypothetical protein [Legionellales bacterium]